MPTLKAPAEVTLPKVTKGKRSYFFENPETDQLMTFVIELMTEVMVLRDRQDTLERALDRQGAVSREDLRAYIPDPDVEAERNADRQALINRVLRLHEPDGRDDG